MAASEKPLPVEWSDTKNLKWKADLPGPGASSPIVVGDRVFVTCWTGYADGESEGSLEDLQRLLVALDRATGKQLWRAAADAVLPEDSFRGMFAENGYATHTPVSDGEGVYAFFGKSGVHAFTVEGERLRHDVRMVQPGDGAGFGQIGFGVRGAGDPTRMRRLDGDATLKLLVVGQIDATEGAAAEEFLER